MVIKIKVDVNESGNRKIEKNQQKQSWFFWDDQQNWENFRLISPWKKWEGEKKNGLTLLK